MTDVDFRRAMAYLENHRKYRHVELLSDKYYTRITLLYDDKNSTSLVAKCATMTNEMELKWWPRLDHPNILALLECITLDIMPAIFIMPAMRKDLMTLVEEDRFYDDELSFGHCRVWLREVALALAYLHRQSLCHLDLKLRNVYLKYDNHACLGSFYDLSDIREVSSEIYSSQFYQPPEWCDVTTPPESAAGGDKANLWQYGLLTIDLLTSLEVAGHSLFDNHFHRNMWPSIRKILLSEDCLSDLLMDTFPNVSFEGEEITMCHRYIKNLLTLQPDSRMSAEDAAKHAFVNVGWPQLPAEFPLPSVITEHAQESGDPAVASEEVLTAAHENEDILPASNRPSVQTRSSEALISREEDEE